MSEEKQKEIKTLKGWEESGKKAGKTGMIFASLESWWTKISTGTS